MTRVTSVKHKLFLLEQRMLRLPLLRIAYHPRRRKIAAIAWTLLVILIVQLVLFVVLKPSQSNAAWYSGTGGKWNYRKKLTIQANMVSGSSDLTSFPVLVSMTDPDLMGLVQSTGADILFTASDGTTKLDLELEKYTSSTGQLIAWIRIPTLSHTNNTDIYMYYGNAGATTGNTQNATGVWDTNYKGVWHLKEASGATRNDSTGNNNLTDNGTVGSGTGVIDGDGVFVRANSNYLDKASSTGLNITSNLTVEAWGTSNDITDSSNNLLVSKDGTSSGNGGYSLRAPSSKVSFRISGTGSDSFTGSGGTTLSSNTWYMFAGVYIPSTSVTVFLNGVQDGQNTSSIPAAIFNSTGNPEIGSRNGGSNLWDGMIDEVRISNTARSSDWLKTEYNNYSAPAQYVSSGYQEKYRGVSAVLHWNLDDGYGTVTHDISGQGNEGTITSATWQPEDMCAVGKCLKFNGSTNYVKRTYANDTELDPGTGSFTVSSWFRHSSTMSGTTDTLIARSDGGIVNGVGYKVYMDSTAHMCFGIDAAAGSFTSSGDQACSTGTYADSQWHFIEAVKSTTASLTVYIDGIQVVQDASITASNINGSSSPFIIGMDADAGSTNSNAWDGFIDDVKVYDGIRSATDIQGDYASRGGTYETGGTFGAPNPAQSLSNGLVGYWKMDEASWANTCASTPVIDSSGNANNANACPNLSAATVGIGKFANAGSFDGTNDYVEMPTTYAVSNTSMTISYWMNPSALPAGGFSNTVVAQRQTAGNSDADFATSLSPTGTVGFYASQNAYAQFTSCATTGTIATGTWSYFTAVVDNASSKVYLYINGKYDTSCALAAPLNTNGSTALRVGYQFDAGNEKYYNGKLDDMRIYNRPLSAADVRYLYDWGPAPVAYWNFNEGTGTSAADSTGNGNTGTLTNSPIWGNGMFGSGVNFRNSTSTNVVTATTSFSDLKTMTYEAWFYPRTSGGSGLGRIFQKKNATIAEPGVFISDSTNSLAITFDYDYATTDGTWTTANNVVTLNKWQHIAVTYDNTSLTNAPSIYINGVYLPVTASSLPAGSPAADDTNFYIGNRNDNARNFDGTIDEVRVYNYVRTPKQVVSDMNAGHPAVGSPFASAIGQWKFDEGAGTLAHNAGSAGTSLDGTLTSMATGSTSSGWTNGGKFGKGMGFDGSNDYITLGNPTGAQITGDLSLSAWVKLSSITTNEDIIAKRGAVNQWGYRLWVDSSGIPKFDLSKDGSQMATVSASTALVRNSWYHIVGTYASSSAMTIYINAQQQGINTSSIYPFIKNSTANLNIGAENGGASNFLTGTLDEVKIYNYALSQDEVNVEYNQGKGQVLGSLSTDADGNTASNSASRAYCPPGDSSGNCAAGSDASPLLEWNFDENSGTTANDTSGNGLDGTFTNGPVWGLGKISGAVDTDGVDDFVTNNSTTLSLAGSVTMETWVKVQSIGSGDQSLIDRTNNNDGYAIYYKASDQKLRVRAGNTTAYTDLTGNTALTTGVWYHVVGVITGSNYYLYINGVLDNSGTFTGPMTAATGINFHVGSRNTVQYINAAFDQVRIYNYARTAAEIAWDYNKGGPVGWWKLDDCTGTTAHDSSGQAFDGTITIGGTVPYTSAGTCNSSTSTEAWNAGSIGKFGSALGLDGVDDYIQVADTSTLRFDAATADFSLFAWVKRTTTGTENIISKEDADNDGWRMQYNASDQVVCSEDVTDVTSSATITDTQWHLIGCTISRAGNGQIYIDGMPNGSAVAMGSDAMATTTALRIGTRSYTSANYFHGLIDDVRIYNYVLTQPQINTLYTGGVVSFR